MNYEYEIVGETLSIPEYDAWDEMVKNKEVRKHVIMYANSRIAANAKVQKRYPNSKIRFVGEFE